MAVQPPQGKAAKRPRSEAEPNGGGPPQGKTPAVILALGLLLRAAPVRAAEPGAAAEADSCAERVAGAVQRHYEDMRDLSARFDQTTRSASLGGSLLFPEAVSRGTVLLAKPGKMRWS